MTDLFEEMRDLIVLLDCTTHREDTPFGKHNKYHPALPESLRAVVVLREYQGASYEEIATMTGTTPVAARKR